MASLFERYRPTKLDDVVGQEAAVRQVRTVLARGWGGRAWWLTGASGTGKTTLARIIARQGADEIGVEELDAQRLTPAKVREIVAEYAHRCLFGGGRCYIVNEAHGLRRDTMRELLTAIEPAGGLPEHVVWVFTTTKAGEAKLFEDDESGDAAPLLSRCIEVTLANDGATCRAMAERARQVAQAEGIDGLPAEVYANAVATSGGNMRRVLQRIEAGSFRGDALAMLERQYEAVRSTKGSYGESERTRLSAAIASIRGEA